MRGRQYQASEEPATDMNLIAFAPDYGSTTNVCEGVSLLGLPTARSAKRALTGSADEVVKTISTIVNEMILDVITKRTAEEFEAAAETAFPRYMALVLSFCKIAATIVPESVLARVSSESFCELEADIRENAVECFGSDIRDRAIFTVWTLRKTSDLLERLIKSKDLSGTHRQKDEEFVTHFIYHALTARFNVDCLRLSMHTKRPIYPEALPFIDNGLRSAVNAYAWVKQAVDLRRASSDESLADYAADEDQELLDASMRDLASGETESLDDDTE